MTTSANLITLYTEDQRIHCTYPDSRREIMPHIVRHVGIDPNGNGTILYSDLTEANADALIREQVAYFAKLGQSFEWKVYDYDSPPQLQERLRKHGFEVEEAKAIMVLDLESAPGKLFQPIQQDIRRITMPDGLSDVQSVEETVWGEEMSGLITYLGNALTNHPDLMSIYVAYIDDQPVSAAWAYFPPGCRFTSLWGGSTLAEYRGKGCYSALLATRAQEARERGIDYLTVDASEMSKPILEKFGFVQIAESTPCVWSQGT